MSKRPGYDSIIKMCDDLANDGRQDVADIVIDVLTENRVLSQKHRFNWKPIETAPYDEVVLFYGMGGVWQGFIYDEGNFDFKNRTGATHWCEIEYPEEKF
ncbi:hypothetical protein GCM10009429_23230 [Dyella marensis]